MRHYKKIQTSIKNYFLYFEDIHVIIKYVRKYSTPFFLGCIFVIFSAFLIVGTPFFSQRIFDHSIPDKDMHSLLVNGILLIVMIVSLLVINFYKNIIFLKLNNYILLEIKLAIIKKISKIKYEILVKFTPGYLISRIDDDTERLSNLLGSTFISVISNIFILIVSLSVLFI